MVEPIEDKLGVLAARVAKVRRWLVTIAILKMAAICMVFVSVYIGIYAWLDHRLNFGRVDRTVAFTLLIAGFVFLVYKLKRLLIVHISFSGAANFIESKENFDQQLVTAIEYYEKKQDYPYSEALAAQLVLQVDKASKEFKFDSVVEKWQGYVFAAVILLGIGTASFYIHDNYVYFSSYFRRLIRPLAAVEPPATTSLESVTKDIITEPNSLVTFTAEVKGKVPESAKLVLVDIEPRPAEPAQAQSIALAGTADDRRGHKSQVAQLQPTSNKGETPRIQATKSFSRPGHFKYRFEAQSVSTDWHKVSVCNVPNIKTMTAEVMLPKSHQRRKWIKPYTEQLEDHNLEVIAWSKVTLNAQTTERLKEVRITGLDGKVITKQLSGTDQFTFSFIADRQGQIKFHLVGEEGLANDKPPDLEVTVKTDEPPEFKLVSPDGDYLATDVGSIPITFEVTDDFGLDSVEMCLESPDGQVQTFQVPLNQGSKSVKFTRTLELEDYDLSVGDSLLFYARARDIDTGSEPAHRTATSIVYFIEIRPYRQRWHPKPGGGNTPGAASVELIHILEHTRAILKKTWRIASKSNLTQQDRSGLESINSDVQYCAERLAGLRDNPDKNFSASDKAAINEILKYYKQASKYLVEHNASSAVVPEKNAYRVLRKLILELDMELSPPQSGQSQEEQKPDSIKLQEQPHYEKERIDNEVKKLQKVLEKTAHQQKNLKEDFEKYLEQQADNIEQAQKALDEQSKTASDKKPDQSHGQKEQDEGQEGQDQESQGQGQKGQGQEGQGQEGQDQGQEGQGQEGQGQGQKGQGQEGQGQEGQGQGQKGQGQEGQGQEGQGQGQKGQGQEGQGQGQKGQGQEGQGQEGQGQGTGGQQSTTQIAASMENRFKMLQAKQAALKEQVLKLKQDLKQLPEFSQGSETSQRQQAQKHLDNAAAKMNDFLDKLTQARYQPDMDERKSRQAVEIAESAKNELDLAGKALEKELALSDEESIARKAQEMAEQLAEDADALDGSVTPIEREQMLARLEAAKRLLEMMPQPQRAMVSKRTSSTSQSHVLTQNPKIPPAKAARMMANQFWSIAIDAKTRHVRLIKDEPSDVKFYKLETEFFENTAKFNRKQRQ